MAFRMLLPSTILFVLTLSVGCVSASKYEALEKVSDERGEAVSLLKDKNKELEVIIAELEKKLGKASKSKKDLTMSVNQMKVALEDLRERQKQAEKRTKEYAKLISKFRKLIDAGQLSVKMVDGRMVVALPSDVLFKSGSARLSDEGKSTIREVASTLSSIPNREFQIEGHTDDDPIKSSSRYRSNWDLASARAINVVKEMVDEGLEGNRISAASFGEFNPLNSNANNEEKALNRRIEIVVMPDLSLLPGYAELNRIAQGE